MLAIPADAPWFGAAEAGDTAFPLAAVVPATPAIVATLETFGFVAAVADVLLLELLAAPVVALAAFDTVVGLAVDELPALAAAFPAALMVLVTAGVETWGV